MSRLFFAKLFLSKIFLGELIVFRQLNVDFTISLRVILSGLSKLSLSFKIKHNCGVQNFKVTTALIALMMLVHASAVRMSRY